MVLLRFTGLNNESLTWPKNSLVFFSSGLTAVDLPWSNPIQGLTRQLLLLFCLSLTIIEVYIIDSFPEHKESSEKLIASFDDKMPQSVTEAIQKLQDGLSGLPDQIIRTVLQYLEEEMRIDQIQHGF